MSHNSGFFPSANGDREYKADDFRKFSKIITDDGIKRDDDALNFRVNATNPASMNLSVNAGAGIVCGSWISTDSATTISIPTASSSGARYDAVVLEFNNNINVREVSISVIQGIASANPTYPELTQTDTIYQMPLAFVLVDINATSITDDKIIDMRGASDCPWLSADVRDGIGTTIGEDGSINLKSATTTELGGFKVGNGLVMRGDGTLDVQGGGSGGEGGLYPRFLVTAHEGSIVTLTASDGTIYPLTQETSTQWSCEVDNYSTYTITATYNGETKTRTVIGDTCKLYKVNFTASIIAITFDEGSICTISGGGISEITSTTPFNFVAEEHGLYTIEFELGTRQATRQVNVTADNQTINVDFTFAPDGSTVTPVNDATNWLECAGVFDHEYTTLTEIMADAELLTRIIASENASDYLVRCTGWITTICADATTMEIIGLNNYCSDVLLSDSSWIVAIANSEYYSEVLNVGIPAMTSNTEPEGEANKIVLTDLSAFTKTQGNYQLFDGDKTTAQFYGGDVTSYGTTYSYSNGRYGASYTYPNKAKPLVAALSLPASGLYTAVSNVPIHIIAKKAEDTSYTQLGQSTVTVTSASQKKIVPLLSNETEYDEWGFESKALETTVMLGSTVYLYRACELQFLSRQDV